jgi:DNA-binding CsgD family transcriptional regulator
VIHVEAEAFDRLVFTYRGAVLLPVCYVFMAAWGFLGILDRPWRRMPLLMRRLFGCFIFLLVLLVLMLLEIATRNGVIDIPLFSGLARAAEPYGLQFPWIMLAVCSVAGSLTVMKLSRIRTAGSEEAVASGPDFLSDKDLSAREAEIAQRIMAGENNKEIASALGISYSTVKNHIASIFRKCGVGSRFQLARRAARSSTGHQGSG